LVGLTIENKKELNRNEPIEWSWAIKNLKESDQRVIIHTDGEPVRVKLQVLRPGTSEVIKEYFKTYDETDTGKTSDLPSKPVVINIGAGDIYSFPGIKTTYGTKEGVYPGHGLEPGNYELRLMYGGEGFDFSCESGTIQITVK
jgi:hypothetical protein